MNLNCALTRIGYKQFTLALMNLVIIYPREQLKHCYLFTLILSIFYNESL